MDTHCSENEAYKNNKDNKKEDSKTVEEGEDKCKKDNAQANLMTGRKE